MNARVETNSSVKSSLRPDRQNGSEERSVLYKTNLVSLGHLLNDLHSAFLPAFLPEIVPRLGLSLAQAGFLNSMSGFVNMTAQPLLGHLADLSPAPVFIILGPILTALAIAFLPLAPSYAIALVLVALWALGSSAYHPQGNAAMGHLSPPGRLAFTIAIFSAAGMFGSSLSPLYAIGLVKTVGLRLLPLAVVIPPIILGFFVYRNIPSLAGEGTPARSGTSRRNGFWKSLAGVFRKIYFVWIVTFIVDTTFQGLRFFLPLVVTEQGGSLARVGGVLFAVTLAGTLSSLVAGKLADLVGRKRVLTWALLLSPGVLAAAALTKGTVSVVLYMAGLALLNTTMPITAAMAQEFSPQARGMASSLVMGISWGLGGLVTSPLGAVADHFGLGTTMFVTALLPLTALPLFLYGWKREAASMR
ncbi:MFS transporter [Aminiphilus circumscriptus]|uniref:MFS transporter n=1 Tax=Aminiphilus circumscriptus TaxID=290732 RepID=UPI000478643D|nr:MFS transporter [Aminiphilus circumscriptus]